MGQRDERFGRYELLVELGRGGMAELFLGRLQGAGGFAKLVAIKRILPHLASDAQWRQMFLDEGRIAAHLSHPNVCQTFELDETVAGELYLVMEYLDGVPWHQLLAAVPREVVLPLATGVLAQAAEGLHYAHALRDAHGRSTPVVHRDVSPQNLFVTVDGACKVLDFGVSKMMTDGPRTRSGVVKGKLPYMAPEQIRGEALDGRADVFSLAVCAWEAFAGDRLYDRTTDFQIWKAITEEDPPPIASRWPACPPAVDACVRRALDRDPARRPATARAFAEELRTAAFAWGPPEIAATLRTACADRLAARARDIAAALAAADADPSASATIERRAAPTAPIDAVGEPSIAMRRDAVAITREPPRLSHDQFGAPIVTQAERPPSPPAPARSHVRTAIVAAVLAAGLTAVVVVLATRRSSEASRKEPAIDAAPVEDDVPVDDIGARVRDANKRIREGMKRLDQLKGLDLRGLGTAGPDNTGSGSSE